MSTPSLEKERAAIENSLNRQKVDVLLMPLRVNQADGAPIFENPDDPRLVHGREGVMALWDALRTVEELARAPKNPPSPPPLRRQLFINARRLEQLRDQFGNRYDAVLAVRELLRGSIQEAQQRGSRPEIGYSESLRLQAFDATLRTLGVEVGEDENTLIPGLAQETDVFIDEITGLPTKEEFVASKG